jgi:O-antigen ligase
MSERVAGREEAGATYAPVGSPWLVCLPPLALLLIAPLLSPEVSTWGRLALLLAGVGTALALATRLPALGGRPAISLVALASVPIVSAAIGAADRGGAAARLLDLGLLAVAFWAGRDLLGAHGRPRAAALLAGLGTITALHGLYQRGWGFARDVAILERLDLPDAPLYTLRLQTGRVFSTFLLPSAFAGFLILSLPATLALAWRARGRAGRATLAGLALIQAAALAFTFSHGAVLALAVGGLIVASRSHSARLRRGALVAACGAFALLLLVAWSRAERIDGELNPATERLENWRVAAMMIADQPLTGVGWGSFGASYSQYHRPGTNQTRYAHNTYLQLVAEAGVTAIPFLLILLAGAWRGLGAGRSRAADAWMWLGVVAVLAHNAIDFTLLLPSVGVPCCLLAGALCAGPGPPGPGRAGRAAALSLALLLAAGLPLALGREMAESARDALVEGRKAESASRMGLARRLDPLQADYPDFLVRLALEDGGLDAAALARARDLAEEACRLDRRTAHHRTTLELVCEAQGDPACALRAAQRAALLAPASAEYRARVERLARALERR